MKTFIYHLLILVSLQVISLLDTCGASIDWTDNTLGNKGCSVRLPASVSLSLPTTDTYELGYFINVSGNYSCVGSKIITPGTDIVIDLGVNNGSNYGYMPNDRFITFIRNTSSTYDEYAVEFNYVDSQNKCVVGRTMVIEDIAVAMWNWPNIKHSYCNSEKEFKISLPYGLSVDAFYLSAGTNYVDNGDNSFTIYPKSMDAKSYKFAFIPKVSVVSDSVFYYEVTKFPMSVLNHQYSICDNEVITVLENDVTNNVTRSLINASDLFVLNKPGEYYYGITELTSGCSTIDTITVVQNLDCSPGSRQNNVVINPSLNDHLNFSDNETIEVYDINLKKVSSISAPSNWNGIDKYGKPLPVGLYIVIHADKKVQYVTVVY